MGWQPFMIAAELTELTIAATIWPAVRKMASAR
jgi:hypothetical protein